MNESLKYGFAFDRRLLLDVTMGAQTIIPVINVLLIHPTVLVLLKQRETMQGDIRVGYFNTVVGLIISDAIMWSLRLHWLSPYAGLACSGPLCTLDSAIIRVLFTLIVLCSFPFFVFLTVRMHQMVLRGTSSRWLLSTRCQLALFVSLFIVQVLNIFGFAMAYESEKADSIAQRPELRWIVKRGGRLLIFGEFGQPEQIKYELIFLSCSVIVQVPIVFGFSLYSIRRLTENRKNLISNRTLQMTNQMVEVFQCQLKWSVLHVLIPMLVFLFTSTFDTRHLLPGIGHTILRFVISMLVITNPLQFSLVFILKSSELKKFTESKLLPCLKTDEPKQVVYERGSAESDGSTALSTTYSFPLLRWR